MKKVSQPLAESLLVLTTAVWGSTFLIIKLMVSGGAANSPFALLTSRFVLATALSLIILYPKRLPSREEIIGGLIIGLAAFAGFAFQTIGLVHTTPAKSGFITSLFVLLVPFLSRFWEKAKIPFQVYLALIPAVIGLWTISGAGWSISEINPGDKITFLSACAYAFQIVGIQIYTSRGDWRWLSIFQFAIIALGSFIGMLFEHNSVFLFNQNNVIGIVYLSAIATVGALGMQLFAQKHTSSARASLIYIAEPIFAAVIAWGFAGHKMTSHEIIGAAFIMLSMLVGRIRVRGASRAAA
jgi:drug/metabolite transporter (DMT)-like permease